MVVGEGLLDLLLVQEVLVLELEELLLLLDEHLGVIGRERS